MTTQKGADAWGENLDDCAPNTRNGNVTTARNVIPRDGKTRTFSTTGKDAQGRSVNIVVVYDKQCFEHLESNAAWQICVPASSED
jgi:hypothetical protein